jgi:hypothetical protein
VTPLELAAHELRKVTASLVQEVANLVDSGAPLHVSNATGEVVHRAVANLLGAALDAEPTPDKRTRDAEELRAAWAAAFPTPSEQAAKAPPRPTHAPGGHAGAELRHFVHALANLNLSPEVTITARDALEYGEVVRAITGERVTHDPTIVTLGCGRVVIRYARLTPGEL